MTSTRSRQRDRAFTLVELLVVLGVIVLLAGLLIAVFPALAQRSEIQKTRNILTLLDLGLSEWSGSADRRISFGRDGFVDGTPVPTARYDVQADSPHLLMVTELLATITRNEDARSVITTIDPANLVRIDTSAALPEWVRLLDPNDPDQNAGQVTTYFNDNETPWDAGTALDDQLVVLDAWNTPIRMIHAGRVAVPGVDSVVDVDDTIVVEDVSTGAAYSGVEAHYGRAVNRRIAFVSAGPDERFGTLTEDPGTPEYDATLDNIYSYEVIRP